MGRAGKYFHTRDNDKGKTMNEQTKEIQTQEFTREQIELVKQTVAKGATDNELKLFLHNCKRLGLDPFAKQVHFIKYGNSPGSIVVGLDGFRLVAERTGKHSGTKRGAIRDSAGVLVGAWCEVYRSDWEHPAREEVPFAEYNNPRNPSWQRMPETMIKKVAECAALRMAFPAELSGVYGHEEMDQADKPEKVDAFANPDARKPLQVVSKTEPVDKPQPDPKPQTEAKQTTQTPRQSGYLISFGRYTGKYTADIADDELGQYYHQLTGAIKKSGKAPDANQQSLIDALAAERTRRQILESGEFSFGDMPQ